LPLPGSPQRWAGLAEVAATAASRSACLIRRSFPTITASSPPRRASSSFSRRCSLARRIAAAVWKTSPGPFSTAPQTPCSSSPSVASPGAVTAITSGGEARRLSPACSGSPPGPRSEAPTTATSRRSLRASASAASALSAVSTSCPPDSSARASSRRLAASVSATSTRIGGGVKFAMPLR
jgi:hypothetical protein